MAYNTSIGMWLGRDPAGYLDGSDLCQYVGSRPLSSIDPHGLAAEQKPIPRDKWPTVPRILDLLIQCALKEPQVAGACDEGWARKADVTLVITKFEWKEDEIRESQLRIAPSRNKDEHPTERELLNDSGNAFGGPGGETRTKRKFTLKHAVVSGYYEWICCKGGKDEKKRLDFDALEVMHAPIDRAGAEAAIAEVEKLIGPGRNIILP